MSDMTPDIYTNASTNTNILQLEGLSKTDLDYKQFSVLKKCRSKFDCLIFEMLPHNAHKHCKRFSPSLMKVEPSLENGRWLLFLLYTRKTTNPLQKKKRRSISLTCISCKIMTHFLCSRLSDHLEANNILTPHQHGFCKGFSTETQLISVLDDWLTSLDKQIRTDVPIFN